MRTTRSRLVVGESHNLAEATALLQSILWNSDKPKRLPLDIPHRHTDFHVPHMCGEESWPTSDIESRQLAVAALL
jgi:hypothetical protein